MKGRIFKLLMVVFTLLGFCRLAMGVELTEGTYSFYQADYNGDGLVDIIFVPNLKIVTIADQVNTPIDITEQYMVYQLKSDGTYTIIYPADAVKIKSLTLSPLTNFKVYYGDFDGDGKADILFQATNGNFKSFIAYGSGVRSTAKSPTYLGKSVHSGVASVEVTDLLNDGVSDIIFHMNDGSYKVAYGGINGISEGDLKFAKREPGGEMTGILSGSFQVSESGTAEYSFSIDVPSGPKALSPQIGVSYSSVGGTSVLGLGWGLQTGSVISRCPTSLSDDGFYDGVDFDVNDQFCLDGKRLILVSGTHGASGAEYRSDSDNATKIVIATASSNGPITFEVRSTKGGVSIYGGTTESRVGANGSAPFVQWNLSRTQDVFGDGIDYGYVNNVANGDFYLSTITYDRYRVDFAYDEIARPRTGYQVGAARLRQGKRLSKISITDTVTSYVPSRYEFGYVTDYLGRDLLKSVLHCGLELCQEPLVFADAGTESIGNYLTKMPTMSKYGHGASADSWDVKNHPRLLGDVNGDGIADIVGFSEAGVEVSLADGAGGFTYRGIVLSSYGHGQSAGSWQPVHERVLVDENGDGILDIVGFAQAGIAVSIANGDGTFTPKPVSNIYGVLLYGDPVSGGTPRSFADINGDGCADLVAFVATGVAVAQSDCAGGFKDLGVKIPNLFNYNTGWRTDRHPRMLADLNGDGLADIIGFAGQGVNVALSNGDGTFTYKGETLHGYGYDDSVGAWRTSENPRMMADVNGDGLADIVAFSRYGVYVALSKGDGFFEERGLVIQDYGTDASAHGWSPTAHIRTLADMNGDGMTDIVGFSNYGVGVSFATGDGGFMPGQLWIAAYGAGTSAGQWSLENHIRDIADVNGDGLPDIVGYSEFGVEPAINQITSGRIKNFPNGFLAPTQVTYEYLSKSAAYGVTSNSSNIADTTNARSASPIVTRVSRDNGIGGTNATTYKYYDIKSHTRGKGALGFRRFDATDNSTGITASAEYSQDWSTNASGMATTSTTYDKNSNILDQTINTITPKTFVYNGLKVNTPYISHQVMTKYDYVTRSLMGTVTTDYTYDDLGNLMTQTTVTTDPVTSQTYTTLKSMTYYPPTTTVPYLAGLVDRAENTSTVPATPDKTGYVSQKRKTKFYYNSNGTIQYQIVEPDDAVNALKTTYGYNTRGQVTTTTTSALGKISRVSTAGYDSLGRLTSNTNALKKVTAKFAYEDSRFPWVATRTTDINNHDTVVSLDSWGRPRVTTAPDGTWATSASYWCDYSCEAREVFYAVSSKVGAPDVMVYFDASGRETRRKSSVYDGSSQGRDVYVYTEYNAMGKVSRLSEPYYAGDTPHWNESFYDEIGRLTTANHADGSIMIQTYSGNITQSSNNLGETKKVEVNAIGQTIKATDPANKVITYAYGPFGELVYTKGVDGSVTTAGYDVFGNKTSMTDPDKGSWSYVYNAYGELDSQTDARGRIIKFVYDDTGRVKTRTDDYGTASAFTTTWNYDTATNGVGMLDNVIHGSEAEYKESYTYDTLSRPLTTTTKIGADTYTSSVTYDSLSRPKTVTYPGGGLTITNDYDPAVGALSSVKNLATGLTYWQLKGVTARGEVSSFILGNGIQTTKSFNEATGYLDSILSTRVGATTDVQSLAYTYDVIGNLKTRQDLLVHTYETLTYDDGAPALNRLTKTETTTSLSGTQTATVSYEDTGNGNIKTKSGVGTYAYGGTCNNIKAGPHAVTSITGARPATYCYDQNGNMLSGDGRTITYSAFDKPISINKSGGALVTYSYGPDREVYKRVEAAGGVTTTTTTLGSFEKVVEGTNTTLKYYIGKSAVVTKKNAEAAKTQYFHHDHQGSVVAISDETGAVSSDNRFAYDPWGMRRASGWESKDANWLYAFKSPITNFGYTGHEHIDSVGLIHMGGRVYDPIIGRFLSADPFIRDATDSQALNRYAYVENNPLSYTDPSGFFLNGLRKKISHVIHVVHSAMSSIAGVLHSISSFAGAVVTGHIRDIGKMFAENKYLGAAAQIVGCVGAPYLCSVIAAGISALTAYGATGDLMEGLKAGATAYVFSEFSAGVNGAIGTVKNAVGNTLLHGVAGAGLARLQGGSARSGFISGFVGAAASNSMSEQIGDNRYWRGWADDLGSEGRTAIATIAGAAGAKMSGGDVALGAVQAAMGHIFNDEAHTLSLKVKAGMAEFSAQLGDDPKIKGSIDYRKLFKVSIDSSGNGSISQGSTKIEFQGKNLDAFGFDKDFHGLSVDAKLNSNGDFDVSGSVDVVKLVPLPSRAQNLIRQFFSANITYNTTIPITDPIKNNSGFLGRAATALGGPHDGGI